MELGWAARMGSYSTGKVGVAAMGLYIMSCQSDLKIPSTLLLCSQTLPATQILKLLK